MGGARLHHAQHPRGRRAHGESWQHWGTYTHQRTRVINDWRTELYDLSSLSKNDMVLLGRPLIPLSWDQVQQHVLIDDWNSWYFDYSAYSAPFRRATTWNHRVELGPSEKKRRKKRRCREPLVGSDSWVKARSKEERPNGRTRP